MRVFSAHTRAGAAPVLVPERFSWGAAIFGPVWLWAHRAWIAGIVALFAAMAAGWLAPREWRLALVVALGWLLGLFGQDFRRWSLARRGFLLAHVVAARDQDDALARLLGRRPESDRTRPAMKVAVIDYGSGNLASAARALAVAAERAGIAAEVSITADPATVARAERIVLPGQGAFADCTHGLAAIPGLRHAIIAATDAGTPFLGICVGMQLMARRGLEHEITPGFGWIAGDIAAMRPPEALRLPQMGWNELSFTPGAHPLLDGLAPGDHAYFVHSYALAGGDPEDCLATTDYGGPVVAMVARKNRVGTQFHVEKSQAVGLRILENFLRWAP